MSKQENYIFNKKGIFIASDDEPIQIANFSARVVEEIESRRLDGGIERVLKLVVWLNGVKLEITTSYEMFVSGEWVGSYLGLDAVVFDINGMTTKKLSKVITAKSNKKTKITKTPRLGFQLNNGQLHYCFNDGSLAAGNKYDQNLMAEISGGLRHCHIPKLDPSDSVEQLAYQLLSIANISPKNPHLGSLLLASVFRAVLTSVKLCEVTIYIVGESGSGKTTMALIAQACFGAEFKNPPVTWEATPKSIELMTQQASNMVLLIDDFTKAQNNVDVARIVERVIGSIGNGTARGFAVSSTQLADSVPIQAQVILTGEFIPEVMIDSRKARTCFCSVASGIDMDLEVISHFQDLAASGVFAKAMGPFISYVLDDYQNIKKYINSVFDKYRDKAIKKLDRRVHPRTSSNYADLMLGFYYFYRFCLKNKIMSKEEASDGFKYHSNVLVELFNMQPVIHANQDVKESLGLKLSEFFSGDGFLLIDMNKSRDKKYLEEQSNKFIGWVDHLNHRFYVKSDMTNKIIDKLPKDISSIIPGGKKAFWKSIDQLGLLVEKDLNGGKNVVRRTIDGKSERVYSLSYSLIDTDFNAKTNSSKSVA